MGPGRARRERVRAALRVAVEMTGRALASQPWCCSARPVGLPRPLKFREKDPPGDIRCRAGIIEQDTLNGHGSIALTDQIFLHSILFSAAAG